MISKPRSSENHQTTTISRRDHTTAQQENKLDSWISIFYTAFEFLFLFETTFFIIILTFLKYNLDLTFKDDLRDLSSFRFLFLFLSCFRDLNKLKI